MHFLLSFQLPHHTASDTRFDILNMDTIIIVLLCLLALVFAFGAAGMAQMLQAQKPTRNSEV